MTIDEKIIDEKLQYDINREAAKISALLSNKIHKGEYLTGEDTLPSSNQQITEQARFTYSPLRKAFDKQIKTIDDQGKKKVLNTLKSDNNKKLEIKNEDIIPKSAFPNDETKEEINKIAEMEITIDREKLVYKVTEYTYDYRNLRTIRMFGRDIYEGRISLEKADEDQSNLMNEIRYFDTKTRPQNDDKKNEKKKLFLKTCIIFLRQEKKLLVGLKAKYF